MEESGLTINPGRVLGVFETFPTIKGEACHIVRVYYEAAPQTLEVVLSQDHAEFAWVTAADLEGKECVSDVEELVKLVLIS
jgi:8-oxo-dGTP pyrophosphatase MutT (NUDIX family)